MTTNNDENLSDSLASLTGGETSARIGKQRPLQLRWIWMGLFVLMAALSPAWSMAQGSLGKLPGHNKMRGSRQQAFSGVVQSLDRKLKILNVTTHHGEDTEIFPVRRGTHVETLNGKRLSLSSLARGTDVLIYYSESGGKRSVREVIVLEAAHKKKEAEKRRS